MMTAQNAIIRNATVLTVTKGILPKTDILITGGKIARIGGSITPLPGYQVIDATDKYVLPGII
jgi:imidazolonepropionase-like amidohydrolase